MFDCRLHHHFICIITKVVLVPKSLTINYIIMIETINPKAYVSSFYLNSRYDKCMCVYVCVCVCVYVCVCVCVYVCACVCYVT